jgi:PII-like signaling protein
VIIVDTEDRIRAFLPELDELCTGGLATIEPVEIVEPDPPLEWPRESAPSVD